MRSLGCAFARGFFCVVMVTLQLFYMTWGGATQIGGGGISAVID